jgi:glycosyltransferase involved in cell wall biosynthesis
MTEQYLAAGIGRASQYQTIHSGMNVEAFLQAKPDHGLRSRLGIGVSDVVVGKVARLFRLKGHEYLFEAAGQIVSAVPNVKFLLVGDGIYRERYERWAGRLGMGDRFVFAGLVAPAEIPAHMALMDVLVHLSLREGLPRTLPQALACGKPVVAFDVDGAREVCRDGETGFLVRAGDVEGMARGVIRLLRDNAMASRMGAKGREMVQTMFAEETMVRRLDELYRRLCAGKR